MKNGLTILLSLFTIIILFNTTVLAQGFTAPQFEVANFGYNAAKWRVENNLRHLADVNGDKRADIVGFGYSGVFVSYATAGDNFTAPQKKLTGFSYNNGAGGWLVAPHPRYLADVNGDKKADIVGFAKEGVYVSFATSSGFTAPQLKLADFGSEGGWGGNDARELADVNGDGRVDIVGFNEVGVYVSYSTGSGFTVSQLELADFQNVKDIDNFQDPRFLADVNGDGRADIIGFGSTGVKVSYAVAGDNFTLPQELGPLGLGSKNVHLADVNGDKRADLINFASDGVRVAYSTGNNFTTAQLKIADFGENAGGWRAEKHPRYLADVNGDGRADIVGFSDAGVVVSYAVAGNNFTEPQFEIANFGYNAGGWRVEQHPRYVTDVNGDRRADIVGFANDGVIASYAIVRPVPNPSASAKIDNEKTSDEQSSENKLRINPNPVTSQTIIEYVIGEEGPVNLSLYDTKGSFVTQIVNISSQKPGTYTATFNASSLVGGVYLIKMTSKGNKVLSKSIVYQK